MVIKHHGTDTGKQPDMFGGPSKDVTIEGKGKESQADLFAHGKLVQMRAEAKPTELTGDTSTASGPDLDKEYNFRYKIIELDDIIASHTTSMAPNPKYTSELQPRVRDRAASRLQVEKIAKGLKPKALLVDVEALDRGPMIIGPDKMVESGNGRIIALQIAATEHPANFTEYRTGLIDRSKKYGFDPDQVANMKQPVLVRERKTEIDRKIFVAEANQMAVMAMSPYEQALQDSKSIKDTTLAGLTVSENQSIDQALLSSANRPLVQEFAGSLPNNERAAIQDDKGNLNQAGLQRLKGALFAKTYPGESGNRLTKAFIESLDPTVKSIENGLFASLPAIAKSQGLIKEGERDTELSISEDLSKSVDMMARLKSTGMSPEIYIKQSEMFDRQLTPTQERLLLYLNDIGRSSKKVRDFTNEYAERVENSPHPQQVGMFGAGTRINKEELLESITGRNFTEDTGTTGIGTRLERSETRAKDTQGYDATQKGTSDIPGREIRTADDTAVSGTGERVHEELPEKGIPEFEETKETGSAPEAQSESREKVREESDTLRRVGKSSMEPSDTDGDTGLRERLEAEPLIPGTSETSKPRDIILNSESDIGYNDNATTRFYANIEAIQTLKAIEKEERQATPEEQAILAKYSGFGDSAFNDAFPSQRSYNADNAWKTRGEALKEITTDEEYESIESSRLNAFFTTPQIINTTWDTLKKLGVDNISHPHILEPAAGSGRFLGYQPADLAARSQRTAVEIDELSGRMLKQTYPDTAVYVMGYQKAPIPDNSIDIAISNVPFGNYSVSDPAFAKGRKELTKSIHNYYFAKTLDKLKPGGVMAFITSRYTLDAPQAEMLRKNLAERADLLAAIRLPEDTFPDTKVVTDLIFLRKRQPDEPAGDDSWVNTTEQKFKAQYDRELPVKVNNYYIEHPEMILGKQQVGSGRFGPTYTVVSIEDSPPVHTRIQRAVSTIPGNVIQDTSVRDDIPRSEYMPSAVNVHEGARVIGEDGDLYTKQSGILVKSDLSKADQSKIKAMLAIQDSARNVIKIQVDNGKDEELNQSQKELNQLYNQYVTVNGPLNSADNKALMKKDPAGPFLMALEKDDKEHPSAALKRVSTLSQAKADDIKMPIFKGRTIHGVQQKDINTDSDAEAATLSETGRLDFKRMGELLGQPADQVKGSLAEKGLIYKNPVGDWETADKYLSGDVREKLSIAESAAMVQPEYNPNVKALKIVQPADLPPSQISVGLGAHWIPADDVNKFTRELLNGSRYLSTHC